MASLYKTVTKGEVKPIPRQYSDHLQHIISRMLTVRPKNRISLCKCTSAVLLIKMFFVVAEELLQDPLI